MDKTGIRYLIEFYNFKDKNLARTLNENEMTIASMLRKEQKNVPFSLMEKMSNYLGITIDFLLGIEDELGIKIYYSDKEYFLINLSDYIYLKAFNNKLFKENYDINNGIIRKTNTLERTFKNNLNILKSSIDNNAVINRKDINDPYSFRYHTPERRNIYNKEVITKDYEYLLKKANSRINEFIGDAYEEIIVANERTDFDEILKYIDNYVKGLKNE